MSRAIQVVALATMLAATAGCDRSAPADEAPPAFTEPGTRAGFSDSSSVHLRFTEIAQDVGVRFVHETGAFGEKWMPETMGSGGGFLDWDSDGLPDILLVNGMAWPGHEGDRARATARLFRNRGDGGFEDRTPPGLDAPIYGMGAAFADYDGDGDPDVYLTAVGTNRLLRNDGGRFTDVATALGVTGNSGAPGDSPAWSTAATWFDVDRDGWLDLVVCNYVRWTPETDLFTTLDGTTKSYATPQRYEGETCRLYQNLQGRGFDDVTEAAGLLNPAGKSMGIAVDDFDGDGWFDFVVANDTYANFLYFNNGDGTFRDGAVRAGVAFDEVGRARAGMGVDVADLTGDGQLSIVVGNFSNEPVGLFTEVGNGLFQDRAGAARLTRASLLSLTFGVAFADFDLDGNLDLLLANGHIEPDIASVQEGISFAQRLQLFLGDGEGRFRDVSDQVGPSFTEPLVARALATADYDRDGDLDFLVTTNGDRARLFRNDLPAGESRWIRLRLEGMAPNRGAVGAVVTVYTGEHRQRRVVRTGVGYLSQSESNPVLIGLGDASVADSVTVRWPTTGREDRIGPVSAGETRVVTESGGQTPR